MSVAERRGRVARYVRRASIRRGLRGQSTLWRGVYAASVGRELLGRTSLRRGVIGRHGVWRAVFALHSLRRALKSLSAPQVVAVEKLKPGQFVRIEAIDPATLEAGERR